MVNSSFGESGESLNFSFHLRNKEDNNVEKEFKLGMPLVFYLSAFCIGCLLNIVLILKMLLITKSARQRNQKSNAVLTANLAFVSVGLAFCVLFNTSTVFFFLPVRPSFCRLAAYIKNTFLCAYPVNMLVMIRERLRGPQNREKGFHRTLILVAFIWTIAASFSIPTAYMTQPRGYTSWSNIDTCNCISVNLFGSFTASSIYEVSKCFLFYVLVAAELFRMAQNLWEKAAAMKLLNDVPSEVAQNNTHSIRLAYFHLVTFAVCWFPAGFFSSYRRLCIRFERDLNENFDYPANNGSVLSVFVGLVMYSYSLLVPALSHLFFEARWRNVCNYLCHCGAFTIECYCECINCDVISPRSEQSIELQGLTTCEGSSVAEPVPQSQNNGNLEMDGLQKRTEIPSCKNASIVFQDDSACALSTTINETKVDSVKEWLI